MGILSAAMDGLERRNLKNPTQKLIDALRSGWSTYAGVAVTPEKALHITAVFACVRILAEDVASLPLPVYRRQANGNKERAREHPLYRLLHDEPNPEMTAVEFRETLMGHLALRGNAYAEIDWNERTGWPRALWPLRPDKVLEVKRNERGDLVYRYELPERFSGRIVELPGYRVFHLRGLGSNGIVGYSPIKLARQAVGLALAAEEYGGRFYSNDARPGGVLRHPGQLSDPAHQRLKKSWESRHQGLDRSHRIGILEEGMEYQEIGLAPEDAQFLESRKFQVTEIARIFRMQPHKLADLDRATFSNIEHQSLEYVVNTLRPWLVRWEQRIQQDLILDDQYFAEHLVDGLLRGDIQSRYEAYATARQWGWMSANDVRQLENQNSIGPAGDIYMVPLNMIPADSVDNPELQGAESVSKRVLPRDRRTHGRISEERARRSATARHRLAGAHQRVIHDAAARILRREINDVRNKAQQLLSKRSAMGDFLLWLEDFYEDHRAFIRRMMGPTLRSYGEMVAAEAAEEIGAELDDVMDDVEEFVSGYLEYYAGRHAGSSEGQIREVIREAQAAEADVVEAIEARFDEWDKKRAGKIALRESVRANNAVAKKVFVVAGILRIRSVAMGDSCPFCTKLDGTVVAIQKNFLNAGDELDADGADSPLTVTKSKGHPPYHGGCDCIVTAA